MSKRYVFFAHFNRVNMQRGVPEVWTVHFRGQCIQCREIKFRINVSTRYRKDGKQPRAILRGMAAEVYTIDGITTVK